VTVDRLIDIAAQLNPGLFIMAAALLAAVARDVVLRAVALIGGPAVAMFALLYPPAAGIEVSRTVFLGFELALYRSGSLSLVFGFGFALAAMLNGIYCLHRRDPLQDSAGLLYAGAAVAAVFAGDLISFVLFAEIATLTSAVLIFARRTGPAYRAGLRYLTIQVLAGLALTAGVVLYGVEKGSFLLADLGNLLDGVLIRVFDLSEPGAMLILVGVGMKAAFPLVHNWLTDAYPNTTETGAVLLSPYTTTLAVYMLMRGFAGLDLLIWVGAAMTVYPVFFAVIENDLRKVLAYSTNNQIGFMVCAVGMGTPLALNGAAAHAVAHIFFKGLLFMSMGAVFLRTGTTKATELGGLHRTMPFTALFCLVGAASISALPWFAGYASKAMIMSTAESGYGLFVVWLMLLFASAGVLEHSGIKIPYFAFFSHDSGKRPQEAPFNMLLAMGVSAALCMAIGLQPGWFYELLPFRDQAMEYLGQQLFSSTHLVQQGQLLVFAVFAFMVMKWTRLYPPERPGVIIDIEWIWRKGLPQVSRALARPASAPARIVSSLSSSTGRRVLALGRHVFASGGLVSAKAPLAATAVWTLAILGVVMLVSFLA
jgi:multicomponent Na+:H+ antiporter subunit D